MPRSPRIAALAVVVALSLVAAQPAFAESDFGNPFHSPTTTTSGDTVIFAGTATSKGVELFRTDGTDAGTRLVKDIFPGAQTSIDSSWKEMNDPTFVTLGDLTFFVARDTTGSQLWVTDGTAAGTVRLTSEIVSSYGAFPHDLVVFDGELYFSASSKTSGDELWRSDGTVAGTKVAFDLAPGATSKGSPHSSHPDSLAVVGDKLFFVTASASGANKVVATDGTSITNEVPLPKTANYQGETAVAHNGEYAFLGGSAIWLSDGTVAGTRAPVGYVAARYSSPLISFAGELYYFGFATNGYVLSKLSGNTIKKVSTLPVSRMIVADGTLWFSAFDKKPRMNSLWTTAGADSLPVKVADLAKGYEPYIFDSAPIFANGALYIAIEDKVFRSDGTPDGTSLVADLGLSKDTGHVDVAALTNGTLVLTAVDRSGRGTMWLSNGTQAGTYKRLPQSTFTSAATPLVTGSAISGNTLAGTVGKWSPAGATYLYQWKADGVAIPGATAKTFTVTTETVGAKVTLTVTGSKPGFKSLAKVSGVKTVVSAFDVAPVPTISGTVAAGKYLTAVPGAWSPSATFTYQWYANGKAIKGKSTSVRYKLTSTSALKSITVRVTAKKSGYATTSRTSAPAGTLAR